MQVVYNGRFVQVCQLCHVVGFVKLGWVDFVNIVDVHRSLLDGSRWISPIAQASVIESYASIFTMH